MSIEVVKQFWEKVDSDQCLQTRLDETLNAGSRASESAQTVKIAAELGYEFTPEDIECFVKEELARKDSAKQFIRKANKDAKLQAKLKAISASASWEDTMVEVVKIAAHAGFEITLRDYDGAINDIRMLKNADLELSEEDLELVAGGMFCNPDAVAALLLQNDEYIPRCHYNVYNCQSTLRYGRY